MTQDPTDEPATPSLLSKSLRTKFFIGMLFVSVVSLVWLFSPFAFVILFAATSAVVAQPVFQRVKGLIGHAQGAAAITTVLLIVACLAPVAIVAAISANEASEIFEEFMTWRDGGGLDPLHALITDSQPELAGKLDGLFGADGDLGSSIEAAVRQTLPTAAPWITTLAQGLVNTGLDIAVYLMLVFAFLAEGPRILRVIHNLVPIEDRYQARLYLVFKELANNMVLGSIATSVLQGLVAAFGFWIFGVPHVALLGFAVAVSSFVPAVGTLVAWGPAALLAGYTMGWKMGVGLAIWNIALTGSIDNIVRPMLMRGSTQINPVLILVSIFAGMAWMGLPGLLVGPVLVAFFLSLYTMYCQDYLGLPTPLATAYERPVQRLLRSLRASRAAKP